MVELKKQRDHLNAQIDELLKKKRKAGQDEHLMGQVQAYESQLAALKEDLSAAVQGLESCRAEMAHLERNRDEIESNYSQACVAVEKSLRDVEQLDKVILSVEKEVFADFCRKVKMPILIMCREIKMRILIFSFCNVDFLQKSRF